MRYKYRIALAPQHLHEIAYATLFRVQPLDCTNFLVWAQKLNEFHAMQIRLGFWDLTIRANRPRCTDSSLEPSILRLWSKPSKFGATSESVGGFLTRLSISIDDLLCVFESAFVYRCQNLHSSAALVGTKRFYKLWLYVDEHNFLGTIIKGWNSTHEHVVSWRCDRFNTTMYLQDG